MPDWPYRMGAKLAAAFVGESPSKFLGKVKLGRYPKPFKDGNNSLWYRDDLKAAADRERNDGVGSGGNPWDR